MDKTVYLYKTVEEKDLACNVKSGSLPVLATPMMIAWMEEAACQALDLPQGKTSVGILMNVTHDAPSPLHASIRIQARLLEEQGKIISFAVSAWMNGQCIGKGEHKRAVVSSDRFLARVYPENN